MTVIGPEVVAVFTAERTANRMHGNFLGGHACYARLPAMLMLLKIDTAELSCVRCSIDFNASSTRLNTELIISSSEAFDPVSAAM